MIVGNILIARLFLLMVLQKKRHSLTLGYDLSRSHVIKGRTHNKSNQLLSV